LTWKNLSLHAQSDVPWASAQRSPRLRTRTQRRARLAHGVSGPKRESGRSHVADQLRTLEGQVLGPVVRMTVDRVGPAPMASVDIALTGVQGLPAIGQMVTLSQSTNSIEKIRPPKTEKPPSHEATFFVVVQPKLGTSSWNRGKVEAITAKTITQNKPSTLANGSIAVKLTVRVPDAAFEAFSPEAVIDVPLNVAQKASISVYACDDCKAYAEQSQDALYEHYVLVHGVEPELSDA